MGQTGLRNVRAGAPGGIGCVCSLEGLMAKKLKMADTCLVLSRVDSDLKAGFSIPSLGPHPLQAKS